MNLSQNKKKAWFVLLLLWVEPSWALNLRELVARSRQLLGDTPYYSPLPKLSDQRIIDYLNEGHRYAAAQGWFLTQRTTFTLVGGATEYALPSDFQTVRRVSKSNIVLPEATLDDLDYNSGAWLDASGDPSRYYITTTSYSRIGFYPAPLNTTTGTIILDYIAQPNQLSKMSDVPFLGLTDLYVLHESLPKFVAYRYYLIAGNQPLATIYGQEFLGDIKRMKEVIETKPNYRPGFSAVTGR